MGITERTTAAGRWESTDGGVTWRLVEPDPSLEGRRGRVPESMMRDAAHALASRIAIAPRLQDEALTASEIETVSVLFDEWEPDKDYEVGAVVRYESRLWECRQAHTSQVGWGPGEVLALWYRYRGADEGEEWEPSTPYTAGDEVEYEGERYRCLQGHTSQEGWEPPNVPSLWERIE